ncbi:MAG: hypothetical protein NT004_13130 [Bacteroidetes bacterium]|nr:hypothetical protein [Bacteroidota bacterium]
MIETRGEGGYTVVHPTPNYRLTTGNISSITALTLEQRNYLIDFAKTFNRQFVVASPSVPGVPDVPGVPHVPKPFFHNTDPISYFNWNCQPYAKPNFIPPSRAAYADTGNG